MGDLTIVAQACVVRVTIEAGVVAPHLHGAKGGPPHQSLLKLKRAVLHQLGIQATVGTEIDVLKKEAIHRGGDRSTRLIRPHLEGECLSHLLCPTRHGGHP